MKILHDGEAIIIGLESLDLDKFPNLKVVGCNTTSTEHLPEVEMEKRGVKLISLKGETEFLQTITSTAEHTIGLMIALARNYRTAFRHPYEDREFYKGHTLWGKKLLIIGLGRIGEQVHRISEILGMETQATANAEVSIGNADFVSLHIPLSGNEGFFTKEMFRQMRPTAYLINTSRSGIIEENALEWALVNDEIAGAAVDFIDDPQLIQYAEAPWHTKLILTNHLGGATFEDMARTEEFIENKVEEFIANGIV